MEQIPHTHCRGLINGILVTLAWSTSRSIDEPELKHRLARAYADRIHIGRMLMRIQTRSTLKPV